MPEEEKEQKIENLFEQIIKESTHGMNSEGNETETQINDLEQKEEISIQPEQNEEARIQKNEGRLRNLRDKFKCSQIRIVGGARRRRTRARS